MHIKKKKQLGTGLNPRGNVFGGGGDDDEDSESDEPQTKTTARDAVNRAIQKEQEALRAKAQQHQQEYDFDGTYENYQKETDKQNKTTHEATSNSRGSRYISDLLQAAETRKRERELILERKLAREQVKEEEAIPEFRNKEKFVTSAYKVKLQERRLWQEEEQKNIEREAEQDVTKQSDMAGFYGNLTKNVAMGGGGGGGEDNTKEAKEKAAGLGFLDGFDREPDNGDDNNGHETLAPTSTDDQKPAANDHASSSKDISTKQDTETRRKRQRLERQEKVAAARERYFQRHGLVA